MQTDATPEAALAAAVSRLGWCMTIHWSDTVRNATLDAWETAIGPSAIVRIYGGSVPADESAALGGATLLAEFDLGSDWADAASSGTKAVSDTPVSTTGEATAGSGTGTTCHEQGTVGASGADMSVDAATISEDQAVRIANWTKTGPH